MTKPPVKDFRALTEYLRVRLLEEVTKAGITVKRDDQLDFWLEGDFVVVDINNGQNQVRVPVE